LEIAGQSSALYDKFVTFIEDMESIGKSLESTRKIYELASNKLYMGNGNLVRRAETIRKLGAKTTKELPLEKMNDQ
jgi:DNA recombination protein RmuC